MSIREWAEKRGIGYDATLLPSTRVVMPTAAGFLYLTNCPRVAYVDSVISDPDARPRVVYQDMLGVFAGLLDMARAKGVKLICGTVPMPGMRKMLDRFGVEWQSNEYFCKAVV